MLNDNKPGCLILIVGPSGVGKDTLINGGRDDLAKDSNFLFPKRFITRPANYGGEDHFAVNNGQFGEMWRAGEFLLYWQAHGFDYGIPAAIRDRLLEGQSVIVNVSRSVISKAREIVERVQVVEIAVPLSVLARRLAARGREPQHEIEARLNRVILSTDADVTFNNDRPVTQTIPSFIHLLKKLHEGDIVSILTPPDQIRETALTQ